MRFLRWTLLCVALTAPLAVQAQREKLPPEDLQIVEKNWPDAKKTSTGLRSVVVKEGAGDLVKSGNLVSVIYKGQLLDGTVFDETKDPAKPFEFRVGRGQVIDGWEQGLQLMRLGEKRIIIVPFELGYGTRGDPPKIPKRATLVFEVEVVAIKK
ncbi:peptidylprolyl isomerase [Nibricoccus aquaticus]|uniref:Peptidyl-prolyl cis-trans isomerase n=1 Tax=Nibricoccus aquaticus TaxID=2576891 RepID=A0A290Q5K9_9BACT|nr:FKBP-type peptidyl-prolyl cis-trans isomerase [Nibricoccus aquaticus]ATC63784.1 peptidylprolyl isomerase [Nibricoccus aquaticus]